ncbi:MAG TPA: response regulator transcription factor [Acidobacteriota bacterium]|nr:response regulator transcription factor [Acidobacteriota bacterium]
MKASILLVEDERELAEGLADALGGMDYQVECVHRGDEGLDRARQGRFDLIVLDVMLPGLSGFDLLSRLRRAGDETMVLMLTARGQEVDKVRGLRAGADDYMSKPFGLMELTARVEALLRRHPGLGRSGRDGGSAERGSSAEKPADSAERAAGADADAANSGGQEKPSAYRAGKVNIDFQAREGRRGPRTFTLTTRELEILQVLAQHAGRPVSRNDLISAIWGISDEVEVTTRTIDQHVASLRRKLEADPSNPELLETVYGYGYRLKKGD